ncbi:Transcription factor domain, fungi [Phaffia rhodozyma]|uniref:Transcription factor domain, fungi n=1 Tax=Phaffia rhodozyma TaxID=264483 RepID=A0A0F7SY73_PHARH|nr:Transcription factor domain, fungi [Phaffia rhodozyma]
MAYFADSSLSTSQQRQQRILQAEEHIQQEQQQQLRQRQHLANQSSQSSVSFSPESETYPDPGLYTTYPPYEADSFPTPRELTSRPIISQNEQPMFNPPYISPPLEDFPTQSLGNSQGVARSSNTTSDTTTSPTRTTDSMAHRASHGSRSFVMGGDDREKLGRLGSVDQRPKQSFKKIFSGSAPKTTKDWKTPVDEGIVTEKEAKTLFSVFMNRLNPICSLLDSVLHTPEWTRSTSPVLYTAILMAATQLTLVDRHARLRMFAKSLSGLAFAEGVCEIGLCQALFLLGFWRRTDEVAGGGWKLVGYAIRIAYELGLHREHVRPLPEDALEARLVLDRERTFYALTAFENLLEVHHLLPGMINRRAMLDPCLWIVDHPKYSNPCDQHTASIWELTNLYWGLNSLNSSQDAKVRTLLVERGKDQMEHWKERWKVSKRGHSSESLDQDPEAHVYKLLPASQILINHYSRIAEFDFDLLFLSSSTATSAKAPTFYLSLVDDEESKVTPPKNFAGIKCFVQAVESALKVVRGIEDIRSVLGIMHELTYIGTASATVWLAKNFNQLPAQYETEFLDALYAAQGYCQVASFQPFDLCACQAQFFQSVLLMLIRSKGDPIDRSVEPDGKVNYSWHSSDQQNLSSKEQHVQWPRSFVAVDSEMLDVPNMTVPQVLDLFSTMIPLRTTIESMF